MKFNLESKSYKSEIYKSDLGQGLFAVVSMYYHTFLKYWDVMYTIEYPKNYRSQPIFGKDSIKSRKEARIIAQKVMDSAKPDDWKTKLDAFNQSNIRASIVKTPNFMQI